MIVVIARTKINPHQRDTALHIMRTYRESCLQLPGVISVVFTEAVDDANTFVGIEEYEDQAALESHGKSDVFHTYMGALGKMLIDTPSVHTYTVSEKKQLM